MQKLLLIGVLAALCCSASKAHNPIKKMEDRLSQKHQDETELRNTVELVKATNYDTILDAPIEREVIPIDTVTPIDIVVVMLNKPMLCCVLDVRVRSHLERILAAALDAYENEDYGQAVKLLRLFIQRVKSLECELDPCLERAISRVMEIIRYIATSNMPVDTNKAAVLKDADELRAEGQLEAASVFYERAFDTEMVSMSLSSVALEFPKPKALQLDPSALVPLPLPLPIPLPEIPKETRPDRPQEDAGEDPKEGKDEGPKDENKGDAMDEEEALQKDAELLNQEFGWDPVDAMEHMKRQRAFNAFMATVVNEKFGEVLAGSAMARNPGEAAKLWFATKEEPEGLKDVMDAFVKEHGMEVEVEVGMRFSMREQEDRMDRIATLLGERGYKGVGATMLPGDIIQITLPASDECPESDPASIIEPQFSAATHASFESVAAGQPDVGIKDPREWGMDPLAAKLLPESLDPYGVQIHCTSKVDEIDVDLHARGGRQVWGGGSQCTSGFSVYRISDGRTGIATAAHCTGMVNYDAEAPEADFALFHRGEHCGAHGDVEWKTTNHWEPAEYWANVGDKRNVNSVETWYSNNNVYCVYSRMQGIRRCDRVYSHSTNQYGCSAMGGVTAKRLVAMDNNRCIGGDSGGPWSFSTEAAGVVKGYKTIGGSRRDTFTKATRFDEALGVYVRTK